MYHTCQPIDGGNLTRPKDSKQKNTPCHSFKKKEIFVVCS